MIELSTSLSKATDLASVVISFSFLRSDVPLIVLQAEVERVKDARLVLDTGNGVAPLFLSQDLAARIGFVPSDDRPATPTFGVGVAGQGEAHHGKVLGLRVGGLYLPEIDAAVSGAMDGLSKALGEPIDGNLGYGFLKEFAATIDFRAHTLTLSRNAPARLGVPFTVGKTPLIAFGVEVNGRSCCFVLDTGSGHTCVSQELASSLGLTSGSEVKALGVGGSEPATMAQVESIQVGEARATDGKAVVVGFLPELSRQAGLSIDGILGYDFISRYRLTIDYPHGTLIFDEPSREAAPGA